jgi:cysteine-S-conjugate beta-lyase
LLGGGQMKNHDFHKIINRNETASVKWELTKQIFGSSDVLPMWVADMDFEPPIEVRKALHNRVEHGIYGYTFIPPSTGEAISKWLKRRHNWEIQSSWLLYSHGVVPAISTAIHAFTQPGDRVLLQSPVYSPFFSMIEQNDRVVVNTPLELDNHSYKINFEVFEEKLKEGVKLFLLCNPHNPGGRVWTKDELIQIGELCLKYNCLILSDEIHSDLVFKPAKHIPIASISEELATHVITCVAPSKTFNLAGLQSSVFIIANEKLRSQIKRIQSQQGFFTLNTFGIVAMEAAYRYGEYWLEELLNYLSENIKITKNFINKELPKINVIEPEGTYLIWLDCRNLCLTDQEIKDLLIKKGKLALEPGAKFGPGGEGFIRMNLACPKEILLDGLSRLKIAFGTDPSF